MQKVSRIHISRFTEQKTEEWDNYVRNYNNSSVYHLIGWKNVIERSFRHRTFYLTAENDGMIKGILPLVLLNSRVFGRFFVSLPFCSYGDICTDNKEAKELLLQEAINIAKREKVEHIELRHLENHNLSLPAKKTKVTLFLELKTNPEDIWKNFKSKLRNRVRKAEKAGLRAEIEGKEGLDNFYRLFAVNMRNLGTPVYSKGFFNNILNEFPKITKIFSVYLSNKVIASGLTIGFKNTLEVPWSNSLRKYRQLYPNMLLYWKMIEYASKRGYRYFDFGRSSWNSGTFKFKVQWGAKPKQLYWQYWVRDGDKLPEINPDNPKYKVAIKIWQKLPLFITKIIGPRIAKNLP